LVTGRYTCTMWLTGETDCFRCIIYYNTVFISYVDQGVQINEYLHNILTCCPRNERCNVNAVSNDYHYNRSRDNELRCFVVTNYKLTTNWFTEYRDIINKKTKQYLFFFFFIQMLRTLEMNNVQYFRSLCTINIVFLLRKEWFVNNRYYIVLYYYID